MHQGTRRRGLDPVHLSPPPRHVWHHLSSYGLHFSSHHEGHQVTPWFLSNSRCLCLPWQEMRGQDWLNLAAPREPRACPAAAQSIQATHLRGMGVNALWGDLTHEREKRGINRFIVYLSFFQMAWSDSVTNHMVCASLFFYNHFTFAFTVASSRLCFPIKCL